MGFLPKTVDPPPHPHLCGKSDYISVQFLLLVNPPPPRNSISFVEGVWIYSGTAQCKNTLGWKNYKYLNYLYL